MSYSAITEKVRRWDKINSLPEPKKNDKGRNVSDFVSLEAIFDGIFTNEWLQRMEKIENIFEKSSVLKFLSQVIPNIGEDYSALSNPAKFSTFICKDCHLTFINHGQAPAYCGLCRFFTFEDVEYSKPIDVTRLKKRKEESNINNNRPKNESNSNEAIKIIHEKLTQSITKIEEKENIKTTKNIAKSISNRNVLDTIKTLPLVIEVDKNGSKRITKQPDAHKLFLKQISRSSLKRLQSKYEELGKEENILIRQYNDIEDQFNYEKRIWNIGKYQVNTTTQLEILEINRKIEEIRYQIIIPEGIIHGNDIITNKEKLIKHIDFDTNWCAQIKPYIELIKNGITFYRSLLFKQWETTFTSLKFMSD